MATPVAGLPPMSPQKSQAILNGLAATPPPGTTVDFNDPGGVMRLWFMPLVVVTLFLASLWFVARLFTKAYIIRALGWEDVRITLGWLGFIGYCTACRLVGPDVGIHMWDSRVVDVQSVLYYSNVAEIVYPVAITFVKLSILLQYLEIFVPTPRTAWFMYYGVWSIFWLTIIFYTLVLLLKVFSCTPRELIWNKFMSGTCLNVNAIMVVETIFNLVSDLAILAFPQFSIWRLQMAKKQKIGLYVLFSLGLGACIVSGIRIWSCLELVNVEDDVTWYIAPVGMFSQVELCFGIGCACLPFMPKFFHFLHKRIPLLPTRKNSRSSSVTLKGHASRASDQEKPSGFRAEGEQSARDGPTGRFNYDDGVDLEGGRQLRGGGLEKPEAVYDAQLTDQPEELRRMATLSESDESPEPPPVRIPIHYSTEYPSGSKPTAPR